MSAEILPNGDNRIEVAVSTYPREIRTIKSAQDLVYKYNRAQVYRKQREGDNLNETVKDTGLPLLLAKEIDHFAARPVRLQMLQLEDIADLKTERPSESRKASITSAYAMGIELPPIFLKRLSDGSLQILDGNHRITVAREMSISSLPAYIIAADHFPLPVEYFDDGPVTNKPVMEAITDYCHKRNISIEKLDEDEMINFASEYSFHYLPEGFDDENYEPEVRGRLKSLFMSALALQKTDLTKKVSEVAFVNKTKRAEMSIGHLSELAVRTTREAFNKIREPENGNISKLYQDSIAAGKITLADIMSLRMPYIQPEPYLNTELASAAYGATDNRMAVSSDVQETEGQPSLESTNHIRNVTVHGGNFMYPDPINTRYLGLKTIDTLNTLLFEKLEHLSPVQIHFIINRFYCLFALLHLPVDGNGRLSGDIDDLLHYFAEQTQKENGKDYQHIPISLSGYRFYFHLEPDWLRIQNTFLDDVYTQFAEEHLSEFLINVPPEDVKSKVRELLESSKVIVHTYNVSLRNFVELALEDILVTNRETLFSRVDAILQSIYKEAQKPELSYWYDQQQLLDGSDGNIQLFDSIVACRDFTRCLEIIDANKEQLLEFFETAHRTVLNIFVIQILRLLTDSGLAKAELGMLLRHIAKLTSQPQAEPTKIMEEFDQELMYYDREEVMVIILEILEFPNVISSRKSFINNWRYEHAGPTGR